MAEVSQLIMANPDIYAIMDYLVLRPGETAIRDELSEKLKIDQARIDDLISNLVSIEVLAREGQGYRLNLGIDKDSAANLYKHIYSFLDKSIGLEVANDVMRISKEEFEDSKPIASICILITQMKEAFGREMAENIINTSVRMELGKGVKAEKLIEIEMLATDKS
jgi:predicted transcriptional regulator